MWSSVTPVTLGGGVSTANKAAKQLQLTCGLVFRTSHKFVWTLCFSNDKKVWVTTVTFALDIGYLCKVVLQFQLPHNDLVPPNFWPFWAFGPKKNWPRAGKVGFQQEFKDAGLPCPWIGNGSMSVTSYRLWWWPIFVYNDPTQNWWEHRLVRTMAPRFLKTWIELLHNQSQFCGNRVKETVSDKNLK